MEKPQQTKQKLSQYEDVTVSLPAGQPRRRLYGFLIEPNREFRLGYKTVIHPPPTLLARVMSAIHEASKMLIDTLTAATAGTPFQPLFELAAKVYDRVEQLDSTDRLVKRITREARETLELLNDVREANWDSLSEGMKGELRRREQILDAALKELDKRSQRSRIKRFFTISHDNTIVQNLENDTRISFQRLVTRGMAESTANGRQILRRNEQVLSLLQDLSSHLFRTNTMPFHHKSNNHFYRPSLPVLIPLRELYIRPLLGWHNVEIYATINEVEDQSGQIIAKRFRGPRAKEFCKQEFRRGELELACCLLQPYCTSNLPEPCVLYKLPKDRKYSPFSEIWKTSMVQNTVDCIQLLCAIPSFWNQWQSRFKCIPFGEVDEFDWLQECLLVDETALHAGENPNIIYTGELSTLPSSSGPLQWDWMKASLMDEVWCKMPYISEERYTDWICGMISALSRPDMRDFNRDIGLHGLSMDQAIERITAMGIVPKKGTVSVDGVITELKGDFIHVVFDEVEWVARFYRDELGCEKLERFYWQTNDAKGLYSLTCNCPASGHDDLDIINIPLHNFKAEFVGNKIN